MTVSEAAGILDVSQRQMRRLCSQRQVEAKRVGPRRAYKINGDSVRKLRRFRTKGWRTNG